jgi:large conductance mechanosensitive channel
MKGDVLSLATAVIIGGAFGKIINSLVEDVIMPIVGLLTGGVDFT